MKQSKLLLQSTSISVPSWYCYYLRNSWKGLKTLPNKSVITFIPLLLLITGNFSKLNFRKIVILIRLFFNMDLVHPGQRNSKYQYFRICAYTFCAVNNALSLIRNSPHPYGIPSPPLPSQKNSSPVFIGSHIWLLTILMTVHK